MKSKVIVKISGGLGNQLFQLAFLRFLENRLSRQIYVDLSEYDHEAKFRSFELPSLGFDLKISSVYSNDLEESFQELVTGMKNFSPPQIRRLPKLIFKFVKTVFRAKAIPHIKWNPIISPLFLHLPFNHLFTGNWQEKQFFLEVEDRLSVELEYQRTMRVDQTQCFDFEEDVALHVRRGDYLAIDSIHLNMSTEYYDQAISIIEENRSVRTIIIFSDDSEWCRLHIKSKGNVLIFSDLFPGIPLPDELLYFMSFKNKIISNSTFSLFPSLIAQRSVKKVIAPRHWYRNIDAPSPVSIYPKEWITL